VELSMKEYSGDPYVSDPHRKSFASVTELPNPDLSPLLNPTLGRNLGRWAEVYFTTPPEKRAEAVEELLRELEGAPGLQASEASAPKSESTPPPHQAEGSALVQTCECGQRYGVAQRFCGMCGAALPARGSQTETAPLLHTMAGEELPGTQPSRFSGTRDLASFDSAPRDRELPADDISEIRWLREKRLGIADSALGVPPSSTRRYAAVVLAVVAIGALVYMQSRPSKGRARASGAISQISQERTPARGRSESAASADTRVSNPSVAQPSQAQARPAGGLTYQAAESAMQAALPRAPKEPTRPQPAPVAPTVNPVPPVASMANPGNGSSEVALAEDYLNGKNGARNATMAARLLWAAVGKENPSAILLLSNMYLIGDGVPKSCDQAKVLLYAAARKHVVQAADKLRNLERSGCP
jgi:hypothetical protein